MAQFDGLFTQTDILIVGAGAGGLLAALGASLYRAESRLSHFREDYEQRDDANWLCWVDVSETGSAPAFRKTPVATPYCS